MARMPGVSQKTVSRVLDNEAYLSAEARRGVLEGAEELGHHLNPAARALAFGRTRSIGVLPLGTALCGPASLHIGIERAARDPGCALREGTTSESDAGRGAGPVRFLLEQGVDGIVSSEPVDEAANRAAGSAAVDVPVLVLGAPADFGGVRSLSSGVGAGLPALTATDHLPDLKHTTVQRLAGPDRWYAAPDRVEGWRPAPAVRGRDEPPVVRGDRSAVFGYAAGRVLAADQAVTAVFAANDDMVSGLVCALVGAGRRVPEEASVVGFDDIPVAACARPPLTTVRQPFDAVAEEALRLLVRAVKRPEGDLPLAHAPRSISSCASRPRLHRPGRSRAASGVSPPVSAKDSRRAQRRTEARPASVDQEQPGRATRLVATRMNPAASCLTGSGPTSPLPGRAHHFAPPRTRARTTPAH